MIITFSKSWLFLLLLNYNQYIIIIISVNYLIRKMWPWLKGGMTRIARLFSHHSFGAKNSLERQRILLIKRLNRGFQLLVVSHKDLTSNCHQADKFEFEIIVPTTRSQYENNKLSKISSTSFLFDFGFRIQNEKGRLA